MLQIEIDEGSGFCFGVTTAIKKAEEELKKGRQLYCLGDIVHNSMEVERLTNRTNCNKLSLYRNICPFLPCKQYIP